MLSTTIIACTPRAQPYYEYLSVKQLRKIGFYAYTLPEQVENELGWHRRIRMMYPLERTYCRADSEDDSFVEPVAVLYEIDSDSILSIYISPNVLFGSAWQDASKVVLDLELAQDNQGEYRYASLDEVWLKFKDFLSMDVVIIAEAKSGCVDIACLVGLVNQLKYIGPPPASLGNPWEDICD